MRAMLLCAALAACGDQIRVEGRVVGDDGPVVAVPIFAYGEHVAATGLDGRFHFVAPASNGGGLYFNLTVGTARVAAYAAEDHDFGDIVLQDPQFEATVGDRGVTLDWRPVGPGRRTLVRGDQWLVFDGAAPPIFVDGRLLEEETVVLMMYDLPEDYEALPVQRESSYIVGYLELATLTGSMVPLSRGAGCSYQDEWGDVWTEGPAECDITDGDFNSSGSWARRFTLDLEVATPIGALSMHADLDGTVTVEVSEDCETFTEVGALTVLYAGVLDFEPVVARCVSVIAAEDVPWMREVSVWPPL